jgi:RND family efflux transporter MFP subunit
MGIALRRSSVLVLLVGLGTAGWYSFGRGKVVLGGEAVSGEGKLSPVNVETTAPHPGGLDRICVQPGTVEPFECADLYAKVSGFLAEQTVDIGTAVQKGEILARISVPESDRQVEKDTADLKRAEARVEQMTAAISTTEADLGAATAAVALAGEELKSKTSYRMYHLKQRDRLQELHTLRAIEARLVEEQEDHYQAAVGAERAAQEAINASKQKEIAARARVKQAEADRKYAEAEVVTARAQLEKSQVLQGYTIIRSPYSGVVTKRNFHPGDFIQSAETGGNRMPLLAVERTDVMRVVVNVPDRDVPFVSVGAPAVIEIDALPGQAFKTAGRHKVVVTRSAASEDPQTRMMRTEIDLANPTGTLRRGMYGRVTLTLRSGSPSAVRVPSTALVGKAEGGGGSVRVVRDGKVHLVPIRSGIDNGTEVEILNGLTPMDRIIVRASGPLDEGTSVTASDSPTRSNSP